MAKKTYWYQNFSGGMDQSTDSALVANNESPLLQNCSLDQTGNWVSRTGTSRADTGTPTTGQIWGLGAHNLSDGTHTFFRVVARDLEKFDGTDTWAVTDANEWPASKRVNMINYLDRLYLGSEDGGTALAWCVTAGVITDVVPEIGGHILAVNKSILAVGGNDMKPNVIFYTDAYTDNLFSATGTCAANADVAGANTVTATTSIFEADMTGAMLYNTTLDEVNVITDWTSATVVTTSAATATWNDDTIYILQNNFTLDGACTGMIGFQENFVSFDEESMYMWDPTSQWSQKVPGFGCVNDRTVQIVDGNLMWVDREAVYFWDGQGRPIDITGKIRDKVDGYGIFDLIDDDNWGSLCAGSHEGKHYLSLGDLSTLADAPASAMANAEMVFDVKRGAWTVNSRDDTPMCYATYINTDGSKDLYYGEKTNVCVYKMLTGTTDAMSMGSTVEIDVDIRTPHFTFDDPTVKWRVSAFYVKYKSGGQVTTTYSKDRGGYDYLTILAAASTVTTEEIRPPTDTEAYTHSLQFVTTGTFTLEAVGFKAEPISFGAIST